MPRAKKGERFGGRAKGTPNKITAEVRSLAQAFGERAVMVLAGIMESEAEPAAARISAAREILDRAYGKAPQPIEGPGLENAADALAAFADYLEARI